jgi:hypothetical protein
VVNIANNFLRAGFGVVFKNASLYGGIVSYRINLWFVVKEKLVMVQVCIIAVFAYRALGTYRLEQLVKITQTHHWA